MSAFRNVTQSFRKAWGFGGDDDEYEDIEDDATERETHSAPTRTQPSAAPRETSRAPFAARDYTGNDPLADEATEYPRFTAPDTTRRTDSPVSAPSGGRKLRPVSIPMRSREKNIYTLKPKSMDESSLAADYLKTGCAVILNLEDLDRTTAIRLVDFMSGVCYGLDNQGHAMKLGETIFLFTPGDYEISSDETDYGENREALFKNIAHDASAAPETQTQTSGGERRSWER